MPDTPRFGNTAVGAQVGLGMIGMRAASRSVRTAAWCGSRTTAAWVTLASWSIVSLVMTGSNSLSREGRPAHQPMADGLGARIGRRLWITHHLSEGAPEAPRTADPIPRAEPLV